MKISITILSYEHGVLRQVLDVLGEVAKKGTIGKYRDELSSFIEFLDKFMDQYHHGKEENFIFPFASSRSSELKIRTRKLISDHAQARSMVNEMRMTWESGDLPELSRLSLLISNHMKDHIDEEENEVFPKIETIMSPEDDIELFDKYTAFANRQFDKDYVIRTEEFAKRIQDVVLGPEYYVGLRG